MRKINKLLAVAATTALVLTGCVGGKKEEKQFMGIDIMNIFSRMNKKTEEGK